jgi:hypothetical protein
MRHKMAQTAQKYVFRVAGCVHGRLPGDLGGWSMVGGHDRSAQAAEADPFVPEIPPNIQQFLSENSATFSDKFRSIF